MLQGVKFGQNLKSCDGTNVGKSLSVVASQQMGNTDELLAIEREFLFEVRSKITLDELGLIEHILVYTSATKKEDIGVVCHDTIDQA